MNHHYSKILLYKLNFHYKREHINGSDAIQIYYKHTNVIRSNFE